jgi:hypothetical protein
MVSANRELESPIPSSGWDPYQVWYARVRMVSSQPPQPQEVQVLPIPEGRSLRGVGTWARSRRVFVRLLQMTPLI